MTKKELNNKIEGLQKEVDKLLGWIGQMKSVETGREGVTWGGIRPETKDVSIGDRLDAIEKHLGIELEYTPKVEPVLKYKKIK